MFVKSMLSSVFFNVCLLLYLIKLLHTHTQMYLNVAEESFKDAHKVLKYVLNSFSQRKHRLWFVISILELEQLLLFERFKTQNNATFKFQQDSNHLIVTWDGPYLSCQKYDLRQF